jgi:hypothetical protein
MSSKLTSAMGILLCLALLFAIGCGKREEEQQSQQEAKSTIPGQPTMPTEEQFAAAAERTQQALAQANQGEVVEAVDFRKLKELLPESLAGMTRADASGARNKMMGIDVSNAEAVYEATDDPSKQIVVNIMDMGNVTGPMRMSMAAWSMAEFEHETDSGYEKTTTHKGYKAVEELDRESNEATFRVFVADRFIVEVEGSNIPMETVKKAVDNIDLSKLASLAGAK